MICQSAHRRKEKTIQFDIELHTHSTATDRERALLVSVETQTQTWSAGDSLEELAALAESQLTRKIALEHLAHVIFERGSESGVKH